MNEFYSHLYSIDIPPWAILKVLLLLYSLFYLLSSSVIWSFSFLHLDSPKSRTWDKDLGASNWFRDPRSEGNRESEAKKEEEPMTMCLTQVTNVGNGHSVLPGFPERYTEHFPKYGECINPYKLKSFKINVVLALEKILLWVKMKTRNDYDLVIVPKGINFYWVPNTS